jgi:hypothetical protein
LIAHLLLLFFTCDVLVIAALLIEVEFFVFLTLSIIIILASFLRLDIFSLGYLLGLKVLGEY